MTKQMIIYLVTTLLLAWIIIYFVYRFGSWKLRIKLMKKLARKLNLEFIKKDGHKIHYALTGNYLEKTTLIEEFNTQMNPFYTDTSTKKIETYNTFGFQPTKKLIVTVDDKIIYEKNGDRLLPFPNKIKKVLDRYIKEGKITKNETSPILAVIVLFGFCIIFTILFLTFILN